jgi:hypothetical protein
MITSQWIKANIIKTTPDKKAACLSCHFFTPN